MFRMIGMFVLSTLLVAGTVAAKHGGDPHTSDKFQGVKANTGTVRHFKMGSVNKLELSDDFVVPDTPAPHWQVVDSKGNTFLLNRLKIKDDKYNKTISVPAYVKDIKKVQIWCAFAETLLGEASFDAAMK